MNKCPQCGDTNIIEDIIDQSAKTIRCAMGHSFYLFKYRDGWETGAERMNRMERFFRCSSCKKLVRTFKDHNDGNERVFCDSCYIKSNRAEYVPLGKRKNLGSPWRLWMERGKVVG